LHAVDALISLVEGEGEADIEALNFARKLAEMTGCLLPEDSELSAALEGRIGRSPLRNLTVRSQAREPLAAYRRGLRESGESALAAVVQIAGRFAETYPIPGARLAEARFSLSPTRPTSRRLALQARARARETEMAMGVPATWVDAPMHYTRSMAPLGHGVAKMKSVVHENTVVTLGKRPESKRYEPAEIPVGHRS
jgi:hypothetical protein